MKNSISRRRFLGTTAAAGAASMASLNSARAASGEVSVWKFGGTPTEVEQWAARNDVFTAAHPDISLNYSYFNGQIRRQKILAGFQTRRLADVIIAFGQDIPEFAGFEMIQPLDDIAGDKIAGCMKANSTACPPMSTWQASSRSISTHWKKPGSTARRRLGRNCANTPRP